MEVNRVPQYTNQDFEQPSIPRKLVAVATAGLIAGTLASSNIDNAGAVPNEPQISVQYDGSESFFEDARIPPANCQAKVFPPKPLTAAGKVTSIKTSLTIKNCEGNPASLIATLCLQKRVSGWNLFTLYGCESRRYDMLPTTVRRINLNSVCRQYTNRSKYYFRTQGSLTLFRGNRQARDTEFGYSDEVGIRCT